MKLSEDPLARHIMTALQMSQQKLDQMSLRLDSLDQQMKHLMFLMAKDAEPFNKLPKGESQIAPCERCSSMTSKQDLMSKSEIQGGDIIIFKMCKRCFYGNRKSGQVDRRLSEA